MTNTLQKLRILQYNVHKSRSKMMITLLNEESIRDYDVLMIQKLWRHHKRTRMCSSRDIDFTLENNEKRICFYINESIDDNS